MKLLLTLALTATTLAQIPEQYPKPLLHTPTNHPATRVLLVSVDGLHAFDLANYIATHNASTLAALSRRGVTFTNAHTPFADPLSGLAALATGGTPLSTGIFTEPPTPLRVNTIFEVAHQKVGPTSWAGEDAASTNILRGPSGKGLDNSTVESTDAARLAAVTNWIASPQPPSLFGLSFTGIAAAQAAPISAYLDDAGTPANALTQALNTLDAEVSRLTNALKSARLYDTTWIVVIGPYGQSRIDPHRRTEVTFNQLNLALQQNKAARITGGDTALIYLRDRNATAAAVAALQRRASALNIADILYGDRLALLYNAPSKDPQTPDIIVQPTANTVYTAARSKPTAACGGFTDWDTHVALLISGAQLTGRTDPTWVPTTQLAPLLLRAFGMEKFDLDALHQEHTPALPGIF